MWQLTMPVIGILRGVTEGFFRELAPAAFSAGLEAIEVTINTPDGEGIVERYRNSVPTGKWLGMGTIRNLAEAQRAVAAGAMFMVTPNYDPQVIEYARSAQVPIVVGALTPGEVYAAWAAGADQVKVFPCGTMGGPSYIKELRGPFDHIPLVAVGGVSLDNLPAYLTAGVAGVGVGASLFGRQALAAQDISGLAANVAAFCAACRRSRPTPTP